MHELSLAEEMLHIIQQYVRSENICKINVVYVDIGALSGVEPEALQFCFDAVLAGSVAEGARLQLNKIEGLAKCPNCNALVHLQTRYDSCHQCTQFGLEILCGQEMRITELEVI